MSAGAAAILARAKQLRQGVAARNKDEKEKGASPGGISTASTVPATDEAAREHVRKSMESHRKQQSQHPAGTPPPVTPASRIRRRGTSHYEGLDTAGTKRQLVLTPSPVSNPDKEAKPKGKVKSSKAKAKGKASPSSSTSTKKVKKKTKKASRTQTEAKSKGKGSQKAAVKKDRSGPCLKAQIPPKSEEETPNGQKEAHRTSAQAVGNALGRAVTQANLGTPSPDQSKISGSPRSGPPPPPTEANSTEAPTKDGSPKKKIAKRYREKTREEKDAHNRFMKFSRSLRSPNSPKEIHAAGRAAKYCTEKLALLQEQWESCKGDWSKSEFLVQLRESSATRKRGCRAWMTRGQVAAKYDNDWELANQICDDKKEDPHGEGKTWKRNPDAPRSEAATLYLCWDKEGIEKTEDSALDTIFKAVDASKERGSDSESSSCSRRKKRKNRKSKKARGKKAKKSKKKVTSSSESESESSEASSSESASTSSSGKGKRKKGKKNKKGKKASKNKDGKNKNKKETPHQEQKRLEKEEKKRAAELKKDAEKKRRDTLSKAKQAVTGLNSKIAEASKKETLLPNLSDGVRKAIEADLGKFKNKLAKQRDAVQRLVDSQDFKEDDLTRSMSQTETLVNEWKDFLSRSNLK